MKLKIKGLRMLGRRLGKGVVVLNHRKTTFRDVRRLMSRLACRKFDELDDYFDGGEMEDE